VIVKNSVKVATINTGAFYDFSTNQPAKINTNNPVVLAQYSQSEQDNAGNYSGASPDRCEFNWDPTMCVIPPTQQYMDNYTFANSIDGAFTYNYINVV